jgi:CDP-glucose 4,6-dehydratase
VVRGVPPVIRSDGQFTRDYLYVEDGARAYLVLAEQLAIHPALAGQVFNFSYEQRLTVMELVSRLLAIMGSTLQPDVRNETSNEIRDQYLDATKARTVLGWSPAFTFDEGLRATTEWYREYFRAR